MNETGWRLRLATCTCWTMGIFIANIIFTYLHVIVTYYFCSSSLHVDESLNPFLNWCYLWLVLEILFFLHSSPTAKLRIFWVYRWIFRAIKSIWLEFGDNGEECHGKVSQMNRLTKLMECWTFGCKLEITKGITILGIERQNLFTKMRFYGIKSMLLGK